MFNKINHEHLQVSWFMGMGLQAHVFQMCPVKHRWDSTHEDRRIEMLAVVLDNNNQRSCRRPGKAWWELKNEVNSSFPTVQMERAWGSQAFLMVLCGAAAK